MGASASKSLRKSKKRVSSIHESQSFKTEEVGERKTTSYRIEYKRMDNEALSPW